MADARIRADPTHQLPAADAGHREVGHDRVNLLPIDNGSGLKSIQRGDDLEAFRAEEPTEHLGRRLIIVHHQNAQDVSPPRREARACYHAAVPGLVLVALLAAEPIVTDAGTDGLRESATQIVQALLASDVEKLTALTPLGFAFDGRQAWNQTDIRTEWTRALGRRPLTGAKIAGVEILGYEEMVKRYGAPPDRWSKINLSAARIAIVSLEGRSLLVIFRKRGEDWAPLGISD